MSNQFSVRPQRGLSAYQVAVANGFVGTEAEWLASLAAGGTATRQVFVQASPPTASGPFLWVQTGVVINGFSLWFEDGL